MHYATSFAWLLRLRSFVERDRALSFVYTVRDGDLAVHLKPDGSDALELYQNATIERASTHPTTDALINLPASDGGESNSLRCKMLMPEPPAL